MSRHDLTDEQWERIREFLPPQKTGKPGRPPKDHRLMLNGMVWLLKAGAPWRDLPAEFGPWKSVHTRLSRWKESGLLEQLFKALALDADKEAAIIDSSIVRAHQHAAGAPKKGGTIRRSAAVAAGCQPK